MANTRSRSAKQVEVETDTVGVETKEEKKLVAKDVDPNRVVTVYNGFHGKLLYTSKRTGEQYRWPEFGSEQELELRELKNAKNSSKAFFENNWFMFNEDDQWVIDYLGVGRYYKYAIDIASFDDIFEKNANEISKIVLNMSVGQKESLAYRARQLVRDGTIDSRKVVAALEESLGIELIEK